MLGLVWNGFKAETGNSRSGDCRALTAHFVFGDIMSAQVVKLTGFPLCANRDVKVLGAESAGHVGTPGVIH